MDKKQAEKIENYKALYNSIQADIGAANGVLSAIYKEIGSANEQLNQAKIRIVEARAELSDIVARRSAEESAILGLKIALEAEKAEIARDRLSAREYRDRMESEARNAEGRIRVAEEGVAVINRERDAVAAKIDSMKKIVDAYEEDMWAVQAMEVESEELKKEIAELKASFKEETDSISRERDKLLSELDAIRDQIREEQAKENVIIENHELRKSDMERKQRDLGILISRIRKHYQEIGLDFKL